jgi:CheY-like chemotaxis protein
MLENAGHTVVSASDEHEIKAVCGNQKFDVAVIAQNMPPKMKARAAEIVREYCIASRKNSAAAHLSRQQFILSSVPHNPNRRVPYATLWESTIFSPRLLQHS